MPHATASDGVRLYYEEAGSGTPVIFVHELAGDHQSWEPQMRFFSRRYRCVAYNARGYAPSDVPDAASYSQERASDDVIAVLDHLKVDKAHVVGLSMGGFATLHLGLAYPDRARCGRLEVRRGTDPDSLPEQGPAWMAGGVRGICEPAARGRGAHAARRADASPAAPSAGRRDATARSAFGCRRHTRIRQEMTRSAIWISD